MTQGGSGHAILIFPASILSTMNCPVNLNVLNFCSLPCHYWPFVRHQLHNGSLLKRLYISPLGGLSLQISYPYDTILTVILVTMKTFQMSIFFFV